MLGSKLSQMIAKVGVLFFVMTVLVGCTTCGQPMHQERMQRMEDVDVGGK